MSENDRKKVEWKVKHGLVSARFDVTNLDHDRAAGCRYLSSGGIVNSKALVHYSSSVAHLWEPGVEHELYSLIELDLFIAVLRKDFGTKT